MPEHTFTGPYDGQYPGERDLAGQPLGLVVPGDIRDTDGPLAPDWRETTDEDREALAARLAEAEGAENGGDSEDGQGASTEAEENAGAGDGPPAATSPPAAPALAPPASPAAVPAAFAPATAGPAGSTPQEG